MDLLLFLAVRVSLCVCRSSRERKLLCVQRNVLRRAICPKGAAGFGFYRALTDVLLLCCVESPCDERLALEEVRSPLAGWVP